MFFVFQYLVLLYTQFLFTLSFLNELLKCGFKFYMQLTLICHQT
jgi:hypothetical protein